MTIELNGHRYERTDTTPEHQPMKIDVFAIQFPNGRPYDYVLFDTVEPEAVTATKQTTPRTTNSVGMELVQIEPGSFTMGSDNGEWDERPAHRVTISRPK